MKYHFTIYNSDNKTETFMINGSESINTIEKAKDHVSASVKDDQKIICIRELRQTDIQYFESH